MNLQKNVICPYCQGPNRIMVWHDRQADRIIKSDHKCENCARSFTIKAMLDIHVSTGALELVAAKADTIPPDEMVSDLLEKRP